MKKEEIQLGDWQRILLGQAPVEYMLEVAIRTALIYIILLIVLRQFGKRMNAQMTILEMCVMITLGAIVSVAMQIPDKGLLPAILVLFCVLAFQRGINWASVKSDSVENLVQGTMALLVADGRLNLKEMSKVRVSHEQIYAALRKKEISHLGEVKRVYIEACGLFSIFKQPSPGPGLAITPEIDQELRKKSPIAADQWACMHCGYVAHNRSHPAHACDDCQKQDWTPAITS